MSPRSWVLRFALRLAVVYTILIIPWPGSRTAFREAYRAASTTVSKVVGLGDYLAMVGPAVVSTKGDVAWAVTNPQTGLRVRIEHGSRDWAYLPIAAAMALGLAVPSPWPGRWKALVVLGISIAAFLLIRLAVAAIYGLASVQVFSVSPSSLDWIGKVFMGVCATPVASYVVPVILWLMVMYRYHDLSIFFTTLEIREPRMNRGSAREKEQKIVNP